VESIEKDWLTYREAWNYIGCKRTKLFELIKAGFFTTEQIGNLFLIQTISIKDYLEKKPKRRQYLEMLYEKKRKEI